MYGRLSLDIYTYYSSITAKRAVVKHIANSLDTYIQVIS